MKAYGETIFDIFYLVFAITNGILILKRSKNKKQFLIGISILILGLGDSFHLIPRMLDYFVNYNFNMYLGIGKLVTSITMTIFYLLLYYVYLDDKKENKKLTIFIYILVLIRVILCLLPNNNWLTNSSSLEIGIIRNIPFLIQGIILIMLYFKDKINYGLIYLYMILSFIFYFIVVLFAGNTPILGMFMLPKTICYILMIIRFKKIKNN